MTKFAVHGSREPGAFTPQAIAHSYMAAPSQPLGAWRWEIELRSHTAPLLKGTDSGVAGPWIGSSARAKKGGMKASRAQSLLGDGVSAGTAQDGVVGDRIIGKCKTAIAR